jgi:guanylate kinase
MADADELLEWATVHGSHRYGTPRGPVETRLAQGTPCILEIDLAGARQVRQTMPDAVFVFVAPPSWEELVRRLEGRGTESLEERERRLQTAREEMDAAGEFDHVIVNDDLDDAVAQVNALMRPGG